MSQPPGGHGLRYAPGLDGVRALAVLAVVAYHVGTTSNMTLLRGGYLGVDVFFVLSGYLITSLLIVEAQQAGRISIKNFYIRRARRLLPALLALLLAVAVIGAFWLPQQAARLRGDLLASLGYFQNWWLVIQSSSYFATIGDRPPMLTHLWSLAVEEQYYLIWPLVLIGFAKLRARPGVMLTVILIGVAASATAGILLYDPYADPSRVYYGTDTRALAPLLGAALAIAIRPWHHRTRLPNATRLSLDTLGLACLAGLAFIAATLRDTDDQLYQGGFLVIALLAAGLVATAGHPATLLGRAMGSQPLRYLGERSYAIYLWHWPVCLLTRPGTDIPITGWANTALRVAISIALAEISYHLIEKPIRRHGFLAPLRAPRPTPPRPTTPAPAIGRIPLATVAAYRNPTSNYPPSKRTTRPTKRPLIPVLRTALLSITLIAGSTTAAIGLTNASRPAAAAIDLPGTPGPSGPTHATVEPGAIVSFFGDSQAKTLMMNEPTNLKDYIDARDETIIGCGILLGTFTSRNMGPGDLNGRCHDWLSVWTERFEADQPDLSVIMIGAWELFDLTVATGETLEFGSDAWDRNFRTSLAQGIAVLHEGGRPVALSLVPCFRPPPNSTDTWAERGDDDRTRHLNDLMRAAAGSYDGSVFTIEPPEQFCVGPIATDPEYRPDGTHYTAKGAALYFEAMVPQILAPQAAPTQEP